MPWTVGSRVAMGAVTGVFALAVVGCAALPSPASTPRASGSGTVGSSPYPRPSFSPTSPPSTATAPLPQWSAGGAVTVDSQDNGSTISLQVGQELVVDISSPAQGESGSQTARSSDLDVLRSLEADQPGSGVVGLRQVTFKALTVGSALVTATGEEPFSVQVEVVSS